ncbi:DNA primase small subunit [Trichinella pseudospiralis]|uniref:DNA primase n=1 Tax=Trichinella pseudospiralis TaxID=6337 RepID=A0A0V1JE53_TRIPS|nr:DNA primase small subunit [Trichinella pseudospiralis]
MHELHLIINITTEIHFFVDKLKRSAMDKLSNFYMKINDENKLVFENLEQNVLPFIQFTENIICRWHSIEEENNSLLNLNRRYEQEVEGNRKKVKELKAELMEARSQIAALMAGKQALASEKQCLEDQIELVREMLKDDENAIPEKSRKRLQFLTEKSRYENSKCSTDEQGSVASTTGIDYDQTDDSLDRKVTFLPTSKPGRKTSINLQRKRSRSAGRVEPSAPPLEEDDQYLCKKRSKDDMQIDHAKPATIITKTTLTVPCSVISGMPEVKTTTTRRMSMNKSASEPHLLEFTPTLSAVHPNLLKSQPTLGQTPATPKTPTGDSIPSRRHFFATKTVLKPENCDVCSKRIVFGKLILRCNDCKTQCHQECRMGAVVPCIARTPMARRAHGKLSDYVPPQGPFIPHVVVHCINEIERRGIDVVGLYRVPGTETHILDLLAKFVSGKGVPNLKIIDDINVLTGCLKKFFQQLKEPLIPLTSRQDFINAAMEVDELKKMDHVHQAIKELPYPNRDTLSFLVMHLQKVADASVLNKMPKTNLAKVFGPTVLGFSDRQVQNVTQMIDDSLKSELVMQLLLSLPQQYWKQYLPANEQERIVAKTTTTAPVNARIITTANVVDGNDIQIFLLIMSTAKVAVEFEESYLHGMLPLYYRKLFPFKPYIKWLRYGCDDYFRRREFAFILKGDIYLRYKSFDNGLCFEKEVISSIPEKIDIGAVYNVEPKCRQNSETFFPVEKEMVLDIDLSDYDEIRECCKGGSICKICWHFIVAAIKVIDPILLDDFGFEHRLWVYSGRRGVHCWVADKEARNMNNEERSAVVEYILGGEGQKKKVFLNEESVLHPVIQRGLVVASNIFPVLLKEYSWLNSQESWGAMLKLIPDKTIADALESIFEKVDTAEERWQAIKMALSKPHIPDNCRFAVSEILLQYTYPRLDMNVSKGINHLLKSPFCIHPKTGKVCVPIDLEKVDEFDPTSVPAIDDLLKELSENDAGEENKVDNEKKNRKPLDYNRTTLKPYVQIFERFVNSLPKEDIPQREQSQMEF